MARQRDHRRIGRDLDLFSFHEEGPGFPFFHPKGMRLWNAMIDYWRDEHVKAGYEELRTPQILRRELWERSRPLGELQGEHVLHRDRRAAVRGQADELPRRPADLQDRGGAATATCRCAWPSSARCTATR